MKQTQSNLKFNRSKTNCRQSSKSRSFGESSGDTGCQMDFDAIDDASCDAIGDARKLDGMVNKAFMESSDNDEFGTDRYFFWSIDSFQRARNSENPKRCMRDVSISFDSPTSQRWPPKGKTGSSSSNGTRRSSSSSCCDPKFASTQNLKFQIMGEILR